MISPARKAAVSALHDWRQKNRIAYPPLERPDDKRLAERIVLGVLHNERFLDACIAAFVPSGFARVHPMTLDLLRISAYQILFLDRIPDSAAVHDAVSICRSGHQAYTSGFVNAVLRKISLEKESLLTTDFPLAVRYSIPDWLADNLLRHYDAGFIRDYLRAIQEPPSLRLQINTERCTLSAYSKMLKDAEIDVLSVNPLLPSVELESCPVERLPGFDEGLFYIQDDAARTAVRFAQIQSGMQVLDVCAAPGGKSIAAALDGGNVFSCDENESRLRRCLENYNRLKMNIRAEQMDARTRKPELENRFDVVIADVPCSGTGVIRKHPEIRYRKASDVQNLILLQREIINNVSHYVCRGGLLLYSTCSILPEENECQVALFLENHPEFSLEPGDIDGYLCEDGMMHSWPQTIGNDGFFAAKMRKTDD